MTSPVAVEIRCEVRQIKSMVDHTYNVTLNLPEDNLEQAKVLMGWQGEEAHAILSLEPFSRSEMDNDDRPRGKRAIQKG